MMNPPKTSYPLHTFDLPNEIINAYSDLHISSLYQWQGECIHTHNVLNGSNLIYSAPTSGGKTLVSEILIFRWLSKWKKIAIFILPFVSIVDEKEKYFKKLCQNWGKVVRSYHHHSTSTFDEEFDIAICTFEKANLLINYYLENEQLTHKIGIVVVDELHMIGDTHRGYLIECVLTKLIFLNEKLKGNAIQLVGMTATMPNLGEIAKWLKADLFETSFRPINLEENYIINGSIYTLNKTQTQPSYTHIHTPIPYQTHIEIISHLCEEVITQGHSTLIFCPTKNSCEKTAQFLTEKLSHINRSSDIMEKRQNILWELRLTSNGLDNILEMSIPQSIAFHHAGLNSEERNIIERAYRNGVISILTATSTLAAGVNLPARRVIFNSPFIGRELIDGSRYKQMAGRAGRTGQGNRGESFLVCNKTQEAHVRRIMCAELPHISSCLLSDLSGLKRLLLEILNSFKDVCKGLGNSDDILKLYFCTLMYTQKQNKENEISHTRSVKQQFPEIFEAMEFLLSTGQVYYDYEKGVYQTTKLGAAIANSGLTPDEGYIIHTELETSIDKLIFQDDLYLLFLISPLHTQLNIDWQLFKAIVDKSQPSDYFVIHTLNFNVQKIANSSLFQSKQCVQNYSTKLEDIRYYRLYVAYFLLSILREYPTDLICRKFKIIRGTLQAIQHQSAYYAGMIANLCEQINYTMLSTFIRDLQTRLHYGVQYELLPLMEMEGMSRKLARCLFNAGCKTPYQLANSNSEKLQRVLLRSIFTHTHQDRHHAAHSCSIQLVECAKRTVKKRVKEYKAKLKAS